MRPDSWPDPESLAEALADWVAERLQRALLEQPVARLMVPGGQTPRRFLDALARRALPWTRIELGLTDERCVPMDSPRRNERMVAEALPPQVRLLALLDAAGEPSVRAAPAPDVVVIGMGEDGHVASLFPGSMVLPAAMAASAEAILEVTDAPGLERRVSRSFAGLAGRHGTALLITGTAKRQLIESGVDGLPAATVLRAGAVVFWAP